MKFSNALPVTIHHWFHLLTSTYTAVIKKKRHSTLQIGAPVEQLRDVSTLLNYRSSGGKKAMSLVWKCNKGPFKGAKFLNSGRGGSWIDLCVSSRTQLRRAYCSGVCLLDIWCQLPADGVAEVKRPIHTGSSHPDPHKQPFIRTCRTPPTQILNQTPNCLEWTGSLHTAPSLHVQTTKGQVHMAFQAPSSSWIQTGVQL